MNSVDPFTTFNSTIYIMDNQRIHLHNSISQSFLPHQIILGVLLLFLWAAFTPDKSAYYSFIQRVVHMIHCDIFLSTEFQLQDWSKEDQKAFNNNDTKKNQINFTKYAQSSAVNDYSCKIRPHSTNKNESATKSSIQINDAATCTYTNNVCQTMDCMESNEEMKEDEDINIVTDSDPTTTMTPAGIKPTTATVTPMDNKSDDNTIDPDSPEPSTVTPIDNKSDDNTIGPDLPAPSTAIVTQIDNKSDMIDPDSAGTVTVTPVDNKSDDNTTAPDSPAPSATATATAPVAIETATVTVTPIDNKSDDNTIDADSPATVTPIDDKSDDDAINYSYHPMQYGIYDDKSKPIWIPAELTSKYLRKISECFSTSRELFYFLNWSSKMNISDNQFIMYTFNDKMNDISIFNTSLHTKLNENILYGVHSRNTKYGASQKWKMDHLLTSDDIFSKYGIAVNDLPLGSRNIRKEFNNNHISCLNISNSISINQYTSISLCRSASKNQKHKYLPNVNVIYDYKFHSCVMKSISSHKCKLFPIISFNNNRNEYCIEYVLPLNVSHNNWISLIYKYNDNILIPSSISIDCRDILNKSLLYQAPNANSDVYSMKKWFKNDITKLVIQNTDKLMNDMMVKQHNTQKVLNDSFKINKELIKTINMINNNNNNNNNNGNMMSNTQYSQYYPYNNNPQISQFNNNMLYQ